MPFVKQPGQYIGGEINQLCTEDRWKSAAVRVAVAFPDTYTIGMSHLGCQILYWLINHTPGCAGDRVYAPWTDAEAIMRRKRLPLFTWDTRQPVADADILAISLQYEMSFSTVLTLLDLAQIPFYAADRSDEHPLVIAGGPQADNPEPVAPFLDLVVLGDGEDSMSALLATVKELKAAGVRRRDMILEIARRYDWAYAPAYYEVGYHRDGTVRSIEPTRAGLRSRIERCQTPDFEHAPFPLRPIVPFVEVVHDRFAIEIMRGCPQRCRFCHAGYTKRPLRLRTVDQIMNMAEEMHRATGIEEFGLLSLSTADYPHLRELAERANRQFASRRVNISVPSLRVDKMLANIPWMVNTVRKGGLTIAVEAARDDMREAIRKKVTDGNLLDGVREAYKAGWRSVKLYFMSGFPGERPEDIDGIWELSRQVSEARKAVAGHPASVKASVGWLVPKPYTPFQWAAQPRAEYFAGVRQRFVELMRNQRRVPVKVQMHGIERSILEGVFARGDRRLAPVIERAWRLGARLDGWDECFNPAIWKQAFEEKGIDPDWYAHRERASTEVFPWAHLHGGPPEEYLQNQYDDVFVKIAAPKPRPAAVAV
ncbi:MAG: TIGR03960 family B12-binding radical SAM protein [Phycisphaerae bacterium]|nr:TIGR03960 family B12-binding radical SAM protein [Planctomycetia bacterium]MCL4716903.1 TIGR03960 family B12-binding radical SAM protein [Phycisphaerae bacterium]NUQ08520.1 TIGR03960 family B12-binding radical SAM protein [Phycisphaerae bacterium]